MSNCIGKILLCATTLTPVGSLWGFSGDDDFGDGVVNTVLWDEIELGASVAETDGHLLFTGAAANEAVAALVWKQEVPAQDDFEVDFTLRMPEIQGIQPNQRVWIALDVFPAGFLESDSDEPLISVMMENNGGGNPAYLIRAVDPFTNQIRPAQFTPAELPFRFQWDASERTVRVSFSEDGGATYFDWSSFVTPVLDNLTNLQVALSLNAENRAIVVDDRIFADAFAIRDTLTDPPGLLFS